MLGLDDLDFSSMDLISQLDSMPRVCGSFEIRDFTACAMFRLECGFMTEKFNPFTRTVSSDFVRLCFKRLRKIFFGNP
jgi:hypothetical protein